MFWFALLVFAVGVYGYFRRNGGGGRGSGSGIRKSVGGDL